MAVTLLHASRFQERQSKQFTAWCNHSFIGGWYQPMSAGVGQ
jgi:hypothetical protein